MTYAPLYDPSHLTLQNMIDYINDLPELPKRTIDILTIVQRELLGEQVPTEFSKTKILEKITELGKDVRKFDKLQANQHRDQCSAMGRAACSASCAALTALSVGLISNPVGANVGGIIGVIGYMVTGGYNFCLEKRGSERFEDVIEVCTGFLSGPCFAVKEAVYTVPKRIKKAQDTLNLHQNEVLSDFKALLDLGQYEENRNPLRAALRTKISSLSTQIEAFTDTVRVETDWTTRDFTATETKQALERDLIAHETALKRLDALILHVRQKNLTSVTDPAEAMDRT